MALTPEDLDFEHRFVDGPAPSITKEDVWKIRKLLKAGYPLEQVALYTRVAVMTVRKIRDGKHRLARRMQPIPPQTGADHRQKTRLSRNHWEDSQHVEFAKYLIKLYLSGYNTITITWKPGVVPPIFYMRTKGRRIKISNTWGAVERISTYSLIPLMVCYENAGYMPEGVNVKELVKRVKEFDEHLKLDWDVAEDVEIGVDRV